MGPFNPSVNHSWDSCKSEVFIYSVLINNYKMYYRMYIWGKGQGPGRVGSGRVRLFVGNRGSGRVRSAFWRVGSKKSVPWTTLLEWLYHPSHLGCFH